LSFQNDTDM